MSRETLKEFLRNYVGVDKTKVDYVIKSDGLIKEGDDLGVDPNTEKPLLGEKEGLTGDYLKYIVDNSSNSSVFRGGNTKSGSSNRGDNLTHPANSVSNPYIEPGSIESSIYDGHSNSGMLDSPSGKKVSDIDKIGETSEGSGNILKNASNEDSLAVQLAHNYLKNFNRFNPTSKLGSYDHNTEGGSKQSNSITDQKGKIAFQNQMGEYQKRPQHGLNTYEDFREIGASLLLKSGGWDVEVGKNSLSSIDFDHGAQNNSIVESNLKVSNELIRAKFAKGYPVDSLNNSISSNKKEPPQREKIQSTVYNTELFYTSNSKLIALQTTIAILYIYKVFDSLLDVLENYSTGSDLQIKYAGPTQALGQFRSVSEVVTDFIRKKVLVQTEYNYKKCIKAGISQIFQYNVNGPNIKPSDVVESEYLNDSLGFWQSVSFSFIRKSDNFMREMKNVDSESFLSKLTNSLKDVENSKMLGFMNTIATIGDMHLKQTQGKQNYNATIQHQYSIDNLGNGLGNRVMKNRRKPTEGSNLKEHNRPTHSQELSISNKSLPSSYLLPGNVIKASMELGSIFDGTNPAKGMLGSSLASKTYLDRNLNKSYNRIPQIVSKKLEDILEAEYVPFYIQDLRTNEIISFHAFLTNLQDTITPTFTPTDGYGRLDKVQTYKETTRTVDVSFKMVATSREDFDEMWYKINKFVTLLYPQWSQGNKLRINDHSIIQPFSQVLGASPIVRVRIGDVIKSNYSKFNLSRIFGNGDIGIDLKMPEENRTSLGDIMNKSLSDVSVGSIGENTISVADLMTEAFYAAYGSPLQYLSNISTSDKVENSKNPTVINAAASAIADVLQQFLANGFANPITTTLIARKLVDPGMFESGGNNREKYGYKPKIKLLADRPFIKANTNVGYYCLDTNNFVKFPNTVECVVVKRVGDKKITNFEKLSPIYAKQNKRNYDKDPFYYEVEVSSSDGMFKQFKDNGTTNFVVFHSDLLPNYSNIFNKNVAPLLTQNAGTVANLGLSSVKKLGAKKGLSDSSVSGMVDALGAQTDPANFMSSLNNPFTRAFESNMGRGLACTLGGVTFKWLDSDNYSWETDYNARAPKGVDISFKMNVIHDIPPGIDHSGYNRAPLYNVGDIMKHVSGDPNENFNSGLASYNQGKDLLNKKE